MQILLVGQSDHILMMMDPVEYLQVQIDDSGRWSNIACRTLN